MEKGPLTTPVGVVGGSFLSELGRGRERLVDSEWLLM